MWLLRKREERAEGGKRFERREKDASVKKSCLLFALDFVDCEKIE
jgi:hypothetical protein